MVAREAPVVVPGAHDPLSARMVESAGFAATYIGSYATSAAAYGLPDVGALTLTELVEHARRVSRAVSIPVLADAEGGFFGAGNMWRTVQAFEEAGVCAVHVEDHAGGKHTSLGTALRALEDTLPLLRAALDSRTDPDFQIIGRTDALWVAGDLDEAVGRMQAFAEAGVDMVFPTGITPEQLARIRREVPCPVLVLGDLPPTSVAAIADAGADVIVYYSFTLAAASRGVGQALGKLERTGDVRTLDDELEDLGTLEARLGYGEYTDRALRYRRRQIPD
ncbi:MAG: 2-methylisocitrate lyase [Propionibacteriales bacterium]|nr:2-methylisocitrate lyase [Propionibacteriales bacterium]